MSWEQTHLVAGRWKIGRRLGAGQFGEVFEATDDGGYVFAVKMEHARSTAPALISEARYLAWMNSSRLQRVGVPRVYFAGRHGDYNVLIMERLGLSLQSLLEAREGHFSLKTVLMIGIQAVACLAYTHHRSTIHRDVKPDNFLMGREDSGTLYLVDYGLAKQYRDHYTRVHIKCREGRSTVGTVQFASVNAMEGREQSRRDDLESLGYCLLYLFKGTLPWMTIQGCPNPKLLQHNTCYMKKMIRSAELCRGMPREVTEYFRYVRRLPFDSRPDYDFLQDLLRIAMQRMGMVNDGSFDWIVRSDQSCYAPLFHDAQGIRNLPSGSSATFATTSPRI